MKYDMIIIGGGLTGLTCGIALQKAGKKVAVVAAGQSTLHFNSGSFDLLGKDENGQMVENPLLACKGLSAGHPYHKVADMTQRAEEARKLLEEAGVGVAGDAECNHYRLTPMGLLKPAWLTINGMVTSESAEKLAWKKVTLMNVRGFLDVPMEFLADNLAKMGVEVERKDFTTPELEYARRSPSEMRATNVEKVLERDDNLKRMVEAIRRENATGDVILLPAFLSSVKELDQVVGKTVRFVATLPPSVPGVYVQAALRRRFYELGGMLFPNDRVNGGDFSGNRLNYVTTEKLTGEWLEAGQFILATGSFESRGLMSNYQKVCEPIFGLDIDADADREKWTEYYFFDAQPYMKYGVKTDDRLHALIDGKPIENLYAAGSVLSGHNAVKLGDRQGVDMLTALEVANNILNRR